jgi:hypothetical protein
MIEKLEKQLKGYKENKEQKSCEFCDGYKVFSHLGFGFSYCKIKKMIVSHYNFCDLWKERNPNFVLLTDIRPEGIIKRDDSIKSVEKCCYKCKSYKYYGCNKLIDRIPVDERQNYTNAERTPWIFDLCEEFENV